jgi:Protein of unknown function (DUF1569)
MATRRELKFDNLDQVMPEVDRLVRGYTTVGKWTLGQICNHLAAGIRMSVHGYEGKPPAWLVRKMLGPMIFKQILRSGKFPEGSRSPDVFVPKPGLDDRTEAEGLRATLAEFAAHQGPLPESAVFGPVTREQWTQLHKIHCAHHLTFVLPAPAVVEKAV